MDTTTSKPSTRLGTLIISLTWILFVFSTAVVVFRLYVRLRLRPIRKLAADDYIVITTYLISIANNIFVTISAAWGLGQHIDAFVHDPQSIQYVIKWVFLSEGTAIMSAGFCRISYAILLLSITPPSKRPRRFLWTIIGIQFIIDVAAVIISYIQCSPIEAFWNTSIDGHCWPPYVQQYAGFFQGSVCSTVDLVLALFPASLFWKLNMKWQQKAYLSGIMGVGLIAMAASIAKTVNLRAFTTTQDLTFAMAEPAIWWTVEANLILITVSVPTLTPILMPQKSRTDAPRDVNINTFNLWKLAQAQKKPGPEDSLERLQEEALVSSEVSCNIDTHNNELDAYHMNYQGERGIRRDVTVSVTYSPGIRHNYEPVT